MPVRLTRKAFDLLALLVERRPAVVGRPELNARVWAGAFVADTTVASVVHELRQALGESARAPRFIQTHHGVGFSFVDDGPARPSPPHRLVGDAVTLELSPGEHLIGRSRRCAVAVDSPKASREHARLVVRGGDVTIEDCGSRNGTFVGGTRLAAPRLLADGDEILIGDRTFRFRAAMPLETAPTEP